MKFRRARNAWYVVPLLVVLLLSQPAAARAEATAGSEMLSMFKQVVLGAAQLGIEEAGVRIMGATGWRVAKAVLKPAMDIVQQRYPMLFDAKSVGTPAAKNAATEAAAWVQQDRQFQVSIGEQLKRLDQGQRDQLAMLIEMKQANEDQHRQMLKKMDGVQQSVDRVEQRLVAIQTVNPARPESPNRPIAETENWYARAAKSKDPNEKIRLYTEAINFNQNKVNAYFERGNVYFDLKDFNSARADFSQTIALNGSFASAYTNRGAAAQNLNKLEDAIADYRQSIALDTAIAVNYDNLAEIYSERQNYAQAYAVAKLRLQKPALADATAYGAAGWWGLLARDFQNALWYTQKALAISPDEKWITTNLAHGYLFTGQFDKAEDIYLKYAGIKIGKLYWEEVILNDFQDLEAAGVSHPRMNELRVSLYGNLSYGLLFERRFQEAAKYARMGLALDPNAIWIKSNLAHSLLLTNQAIQASSIYEGYMGSIVLDKRWEQIILEDFEALKTGGITDPGMDRISARMRVSLQRTASRF